MGLVTTSLGSRGCNYWRFILGTMQCFSFQFFHNRICGAKQTLHLSLWLEKFPNKISSLPAPSPLSLDPVGQMLLFKTVCSAGMAAYLNLCSYEKWLDIPQNTWILEHPRGQKYNLGNWMKEIQMYKRNNGGMVSHHGRSVSPKNIKP